jgi:hypothetical protein
MRWFYGGPKKRVRAPLAYFPFPFDTSSILPHHQLPQWHRHCFAPSLLHIRTFYHSPLCFTLSSSYNGSEKANPNAPSGLRGLHNDYRGLGDATVRQLASGPYLQLHLPTRSRRQRAAAHPSATSRQSAAGPCLPPLHPPTCSRRQRAAAHPSNTTA